MPKIANDGVMPKRIMITGGAGFIGSHLSRKLLAQGHEVLCVDNFYTGARRNIEELLDNRRFELLRIASVDLLPGEAAVVQRLASLLSPAKARSIAAA